MFVVVLNIKTDIGPGSEEQMKNNDRSTVVSVSSLSLTHTHVYTLTHPCMPPLPNKLKHPSIFIFTLTPPHSLFLTNIASYRHPFIGEHIYLHTYTNFLSRCLGNHKLYRGNN